MSWEVYEEELAVHVVPEHGTDDVMHDLDPDCVCGPSLEYHERLLIIHHSLDGREAHE